MSRGKAILKMALELPENTDNNNISCGIVEEESFDIENMPVLFDFNNDYLCEDLKLSSLSNNNAVVKGAIPLTTDSWLKATGTHSLDHTTSQPDRKGKSVTCEPIKRLVCYDSSSSSDSDLSEIITTSNHITVKKTSFIKHPSEESYFAGGDTVASSSDKESVDFSSETTVGIGGLRKQTRASKKFNRKQEKSLGLEKSVKDYNCRNRKCQNKCAEKFTEQQRHQIFEFYWGMGNHQRQRDWLLSCIRQVEIKRRRTNNPDSRRGRTYKYVIPWEETEVTVCQDFLIKTLNISQMTLRYTKENASHYRCAKIDQRGKHEPANKTSLDQREQVHNFIKKLPAVPSHYCRSNSTKKYLASDLRNISFLYRLFVKDQLIYSGLKSSVSLKVFRDIFNKDFNLSFHLPKKDKCALCEARKQPEFQCTEREVAIYEEHVHDKNQSKTLFLTDQNKSKEESEFVCASFDLQKVLNTPHGNDMLLYYSRKYSMYNETVYESGSRDAYCFMWGESDANRGCSEICTVMYKYLEIVDTKGNINEVALYCDSCSGQNKNKAMLAMLYTFLETSQNIKKIKLVYLLPGHTYMPVDSVHATIERFVRRRTVWAPSEWITLISNARVHPKPFKVIKMEYNDFVPWKKVGEDLLPLKTKKTLEGDKLQYSQIKIVNFQKGSHTFKIKYSYLDSASELSVPVVQNRRKRDTTTMALYSSPLPISTVKYNDLIKLCDKKVIPLRYVDEYRRICHKQSVPDVLAETDVEDDDVTENDT